MNPTKAELETKLAELEAIPVLSENDIQKALNGIRDRESENTPCLEWKYENLAFLFMENVDNSDWGTYFGPYATWQKDDGSKDYTPNIQWVDKKTLDYWETRLKQTKHPILQARYAGLKWDLSRVAINEKPHHSMAEQYCLAIIKIAQLKSHPRETNIKFKLQHALAVSVSTNNPALTEKIKNIIIEYEKEIADDTKPGTWGFSFDFLVDNKKVKLSNEEETTIINDLESRLERLDDTWNCEKIAVRLAKYYKKRDKPEECIRIIKTLGEAYKKEVNNTSPLRATSLLQQIHKIYTQFGLKEDAEQTTLAIRKLGPDVLADMKPISHSVEVPKAELDKFVNQIAEGNLEEVLCRIAVKYIPNREEVKTQLEELFKIAPIHFYFYKQISDHNGRPICTIGPLKEDLEGHIVHQISQNMDILSIFLTPIFDSIIKKFDIDNKKIVTHIFQSSIFPPEQKDFFLNGFKAYLDKDYLTAIHILIPQIEATLRNLVEITGGTVLKTGRNGGFSLRTLDDILRTEQISNALGDNFALYARVLLTDQRGWNIRNNVCHGLSSIEQFSRKTADRLIHILLVLALLREEET